jgi:hypothetical protein
MSQPDSELDRLLRSAAAQRDDAVEPAEAPFGFDTRVVAAWRSYRTRENGDFPKITLIFKRIALTAVAITAIASAGAAWQLQQNDDLDEATGGAYAIADSVIEAGAWQ